MLLRGQGRVPARERYGWQRAMPRRDLRNRTTFWVDRQVGGLSLLRADLATHEYPTHTHEALLVAATEWGGSQVKAGGVPDEAHARALLVVNPAEPHSSRMGRSGGWRYRSFYLERRAIEEVASLLGIPRLPSFDRSIFREEGLIDLFLRLHRAQEGQADPMRRRELLAAAFGALVRQGGSGQRLGPAPRDRPLLERAIVVVRQRYGERLTLDELASSVGLTPYQLIGLFRRGTGLTPHAFLTQVRLSMACSRLKRGATIVDAATAAGFYDQSALTNHFKRCYGITPLQYVKAACR